MSDNLLPMLSVRTPNRRRVNGTDIVRLSVELLRSERERDRLAVMTVAEAPSPQAYAQAMDDSLRLRAEWEDAVGTYL